VANCTSKAKQIKGLCSGLHFLRKKSKTIAVGRSSKNVHFGFNWGNEISDPDKIPLGQGNQYRYILVTDKQKFPQEYIKKLVIETYANSLAKVKDQKQIINGQTIVKSVSDKKRPDKAKRVVK